MRDIKKRIMEYSGIFVIQPDFEYSKRMRTNRHVLKVWYKEQGKTLSSDVDIKVIENLAKEFLRLKYFHKIVFINVFSEELDSTTRRGYLSILRDRLKKYRGSINITDESDILIRA